MANMIKFYRGLVGSLPTTGENGALYITTDEGAIYYGTGTGMKRLGDFVQVDNVAALPEKAHESCLYYCVAENILAKWNGTEWKQINKQPTAEELKGLLGLGSLAYKSEVAEGDLNADLLAKVNASAEGNHSHDNKELLDTYTQTETDLADAVAKKHAHTFNETELNKIAEGDVAKWNGVVADHLTSADKTTLENSIKEAKKAGTDANTNIETYKVSNDARVLAVEEDIAEITNTENGILAQAKAYADGKDTAIAAAKKAGDDAQADITAYKTSNDAALAGVKATAEAAATKAYADEELAKKVDKVTGKSLVDDAEITKLAGVSAGANKVEASTNGKIKIDGVDTTVYVHPEKHTVSEISDFDASVKAYDYATKAEAQAMADGKDEAIAAAKKAGDDAQKTADDLATYVGTFTASEGIDTVVKYIDAKTSNIASDEKVNGIDERLTQAEKDIDALETESAKHAIKTEVEGALALKADKSVVDAMYTNDQIDGFIAEAKKHADDNDANTTYTIGYESKVDGEGGHPARIVLTPSEGEATYVDATPFIKDGMLDNVSYDEGTNTLTFTFNTDAGKEAVTVELTDILAPYTGSTGDRVKIEVTDGVISADLIAGSISKDYLDADVKASLALADSAIQSHQDISHLATTEALNGVDAKFANYTNTTDLNAALDLKADKTQVATDIATAKSGAEAKAAELDAALKTELQAEIDADVKALADNTYTKTETFTKDEVNAAIAAAVEAAHTWGEF